MVSTWDAFRVVVRGRSGRAPSVVPGSRASNGVRWVRRSRMSLAERLEPSQLHAAVRAFTDDVVLPGVAGWDRADELPDGVLARLVDLGLTGALVPAEHGGAGLGVSDLWPAWRTLS